MTVRSGKVNVFESIITITRQANTTAYADGDHLSIATPAAVEFSEVALVKGAPIRLDNILISSPNAATGQTLRLWLFKRTVAGAADNAAFSLSDAERLLCITSFLCTPVVPAALNWSVELKDLKHIIMLDKNSTSLFALLEVDGGAYTPASAEVITMTLKGEVL